MAKNVINGVDVTALGEIISDFKADPKTAKFEFRCSTDWKSGAVVNSTFTGHKRSGVEAPERSPTSSRAMSRRRFSAAASTSARPAICYTQCATVWRSQPPTTGPREE